MPKRLVVVVACLALGGCWGIGNQATNAVLNAIMDLTGAGAKAVVEASKDDAPKPASSCAIGTPGVPSYRVVPNVAPERCKDAGGTMVAAR